MMREIRTVAAFGDTGWKGARGNFLDEGSVLYLNWAVVTQVYSSKGLALNTSNVHFIMCKLYLNKEESLGGR